MITLDRLRLLKQFCCYACVALSDEEEKICTKYENLMLVRKRLCDIAKFNRLNNLKLDSCLTPALRGIDLEIDRLQYEWKDLQTGVKQVN
jgi:hypothetical protein